MIDASLIPILIPWFAIKIYYLSICNLIFKFIVSLCLLSHTFTWFVVTIRRIQLLPKKKKIRAITKKWHYWGCLLSVYFKFEWGIIYMYKRRSKKVCVWCMRRQEKWWIVSFFEIYKCMGGTCYIQKWFNWWKMWFIYIE